MKLLAAAYLVGAGYTWAHFVVGEWRESRGDPLVVATSLLMGIGFAMSWPAWWAIVAANNTGGRR